MFTHVWTVWHVRCRNPTSRQCLPHNQSGRHRHTRRPIHHTARAQRAPPINRIARLSTYQQSGVTGQAALLLRPLTPRTLNAPVSPSTTPDTGTAHTEDPPGARVKAGQDRPSASPISRQGKAPAPATCPTSTPPSAGNESATHERPEGRDQPGGTTSSTHRDGLHSTGGGKPQPQRASPRADLPPGGRTQEGEKGQWGRQDRADLPPGGRTQEGRAGQEGRQVRAEGQGQEGRAGEDTTQEGRAGQERRESIGFHTPDIDSGRKRPSRGREGRFRAEDSPAKKHVNGTAGDAASPGEPSVVADRCRSEHRKREHRKREHRRTAYVIERQRDYLPRVTYINSLLADFGEHDRHFFKHVLVSGLTRERALKGGWVPVPSELIKAKLRKARPKLLCKAGLIRIKPYNKAGRCYEYRVDPEIVEKYVLMAPLTIAECAGSNRFDLFSGKPTTRRERTSTYDDNGNRYPEVVCKAMKMIDKSYFDGPAVEEYLAKLKARFLEARQTMDRTSTEFREIQGRFLNDAHCFCAVMMQEPEHIGGGIYRYRPAYRPQGSGRISEVGGGFQSCSREMKEAARGRLKDVVNYDLKSSQPFGLIQQFEEAIASGAKGIDTGWLVHYTSEATAKNLYAETAGIPVDTWKRVLCGVIMGASLPENILCSNGAVRGALEEVPGLNIKAAYERIYDLIQPLKVSIDAWHEYLRTTFIKRNAKTCRRGRYVENAAGMRFFVDEINEPWELGARLAAFVLQGQEAAFVHTLTTLAPEHGFDVIGNEHDGVVTIGAVPEEAVEEAARRSGLRYARLVEKPFV